MSGRRLIVLMLVFCVLAQQSLAARVHGTIYDLSLEPVPGAVVEVNTIPSQRYLSQDGSYEFELPPGSYILTSRELRAESVVASAEEEVIVESDGEFVLDILLYPEIIEENELFEPGALAGVEEDFGESSLNWVIAAVAGVVLVASAALILGKVRTQRNGTGLPVELQRVLAIIRDDGGRITQRELRKKIPLSEAKVSLMVTELEGRGLVKRFKRGRGNMLVLVGGKGDR